MLEEKTNNNNANVDDQVQLLLKEAGLESVPIDPTSLEALKSYVAGDMENVGGLPAVDDGMSVPTESSTVRAHMDENRPPHTHHSNYPPMSEVQRQPFELKRFTSELTSPSADSLGTEEEEEEEEESAAAPFVAVEGASPVENQILEQLHRQTKLLLDMQRRIDDLTSTVEHLTRGGAVPVGGIPSRQVPPPAAAGTGTMSKSFFKPLLPQMTTNPPTSYPPAAAARARAPLPAPPQPNGARLPVQQPHRMVPVQPPPPPPPQAQQQPRGGLLMAIRNSPIFKITYLFWTLRRRHVQELDGGLIFKILFMMAILTARMSSSGKGKHGDPDWHHKFAGLAILVFVGFLIQTGYMQYFYTFFVKENYPQRIFQGEEVADILSNPNGNHGNDNHNNNQDNNNGNNNQAGGPGAAGVPRGQQPPQGGGGPARGEGGWRNTFLGGMIHAPADQGGVVGALQDVALLFGSFLMSIFPMWQPEGPPQRRAAAQAPEAAAPGGLAAGPGAVRPPRDVLQPADDSDDEDGN